MYCMDLGSKSLYCALEIVQQCERTAYSAGQTDTHIYFLVLLLHIEMMGLKKNVPWNEDFRLLNIQHEPYGQTGFILISVHNALWGASCWKFSHSENISIFHGFAVSIWKKLSTQRNDLLYGHLKCIYFCITWIIYVIYFATYRDKELKGNFLELRKLPPHKHQASTQNVLMSNIIK